MSDPAKGDVRGDSGSRCSARRRQTSTACQFGGSLQRGAERVRSSTGSASLAPEARSTLENAHHADEPHRARALLGAACRANAGGPRWSRPDRAQGHRRSGRLSSSVSACDRCLRRSTLLGLLAPYIEKSHEGAAQAAGAAVAGRSGTDRGSLRREAGRRSTGIYANFDANLARRKAAKAELGTVCGTSATFRPLAGAARCSLACSTCEATAAAWIV